MDLITSNARTVHARFDSLGDFAHYAKKGTWVGSERSRFTGNRGLSISWHGGTLLDSLRKIQEGRMTDAATRRKAQALLDKIDAAFRDRDTTAWMPSIAGAYPIVPDYLMGQVECMRARKPVESDIAPIKLFVEVAYSAGVNATEIVNRGTALAALIMRMSEERPVEIHCFAAWRMNVTNRDVLWSMPLDPHPINLSQVLDTIACKAFARVCNFNVCDVLQKEAGLEGTDYNETHGWAFGYNNPNREPMLRELFGLEPIDVVVQGGKLLDAALMDRDPVEWVHKQLEKQRHVEQ